jgi:hypothetical protein
MLYIIDFFYSNIILLSSVKFLFMNYKSVDEIQIFFIKFFYKNIVQIVISFLYLMFSKNDYIWIKY